MGAHQQTAMDDIKKDKIKRSKNDQITQIANSYLQKRNYLNITPLAITEEQLSVDMLVKNETSRPNSIMYSCYSNDPALIDHSFWKFVSWVKEVNNDGEHEDLQSITGPLFCHLYLEIVQRGHIDKAHNFLKTHIPSVDKTRCDENITKLLNIFTNDYPDVFNLKTDFRSNKYAINLCAGSVNILKTFLAESCHTLMLQIFQTWFEICDDKCATALESEEVVEDGNVSDVEETKPLTELEKIKNVISELRKDAAPLYSVVLNNVKDDVTSGLINGTSGFIAYSYHSSIFLRSLYTLKQLHGTDNLNDVVIREHHGRIYDMAYNSSYHYLITASQDRTLKLFDLNTYSNKLTYEGHNYPVYCVSCARNGHYIVSGSYDYTARLWSIENTNVLRICIGHTQEITSVDFHPNATYFCTGSADKTIRMWSINDGNPVRMFLGIKGITYSVAFSSDGKYLASGGDDKRIRVWDLLSGKQLLEVKTSAEPVTKISWSRDDNTLCTGTINGNIHMYNVKSMLKNPADANPHNFQFNVNLNGKLLSLQREHDTFSCLTVNSVATSSN